MGRRGASWSHGRSISYASSSFDISARRVSGVTPIGGEFLASSYTLGDQGGPTIAVEQDGDFVIAWESSPPGESVTDIFARRFGASGAAEGGEFRVNTYLPDSQGPVAIAADPVRSSFVMAWTSFLQDGGRLRHLRSAIRRSDVDIDGNGVADPLTDGLLFLRYLFGFRGSTLIAGAVAGNCTRCAAPEIEAFIDSIL